MRVIIPRRSTPVRNLHEGRIGSIIIISGSLILGGKTRKREGGINALQARTMAGDENTACKRYEINRSPFLI